MIQYLLEMFAVSLLLTLALELPAAYFMGLRGRRAAKLVVLVNILTNPAAVLLHWLGIPQLPIELAVVAVEALVYGWFSGDERWNIPRPIILSAVLNGFSWSVGLLIQRIGGIL